MRKPEPNINQLSFSSLLDETEAINRQRTEEEAHAHLPGSMEAALPYFQALIERHHAAMLEGDVDAVSRLRSDAHKLAYKLNGYNPGILADEDAPGRVLDLLTCAEEGCVPLWGQSGTFEIQHKTMRVRIEMDGVFGIGATHMSWLSFSAHAVEESRLFLSETGYRSFMGVGGALRAGFTPETFTASIIEAFVTRELRGKLKKIVSVAHLSTSA
jgi:hypothetical protein